MASRSMSALTPVMTDSGKRPKVPSLQTPVSASYPSEMRSPLPGTPSYIKREEGTKTPITPPMAYLDFLKSMSTGLVSPVTGSSSRFNFNDKEQSECFEEPEKPATPPTSQPVLSRTNSSDSESSSTSVASASTESLHSVISVDSDSKPKAKPQSPRVIIPPSPFAKPRSAKLPRSLQIPLSPMSPANMRSPMSARSHHEPQSASGLSATPWSASAFSPVELGETSKTSKVSVRQVVTRTVTYSRTPLDPAPKGKRRKIEE